MSPPTVQISYNLRPPTPTQVPDGLSHNKTHDFPIVREDSQSSTSYYAGLQKALAEARDVVGKELTAWRDAVGDLEKDKDGRKSRLDESEETAKDDESAEFTEDEDTSTW